MDFKQRQQIPMLWFFSAWTLPVGYANVAYRGAILFCGRKYHEEVVQTNQNPMSRNASCFWACWLVGRVRLYYCGVELFKMLNILGHCKNIAPSLFRAQLTEFISVCPAVAARGYSRCSLRILTTNVVFSPRYCPAQNSVTKRYSDNYTENSISNRIVDAFRKEPRLSDNDSNRSK